MNNQVLQGLEKFFKSGDNFVGVQLTIPNTKGYEVIINPKENFEEKLTYYKKTYNEDGTHQHVPQIKIVNYSSGNTFQEVQDRLSLEG